MSDKLHKAIRNNLGLYEAVFNAHDVTFAESGTIWFSTEETPPFYSNLITTSPDWRPEDDDHLQEVVGNYEAERWKKISVKDSFNVLDLRALGFTKLFEAQWLYLEAIRLMSEPGAEHSQIKYEVVSNEDVFTAWKTRWNAYEAENVTERIFNTALLANPAVSFIAGFQDAEIVTGCLVNRSDDVFGISNFFAPSDDSHHRAEMIAAIHRLLGRADIVGYEQRAEPLHAIGLESVGRLAVWIK